MEPIKPANGSVNSSPLEELAKLTAGDILSLGERQGRTPVETADAIDRWRSSVMDHGRKLYEEKPDVRADWYWENRAKLDLETWQAKQALLEKETERVYGSLYRTPEDQEAASTRLEEAGFDPEKLFSVTDRALLQRLKETVESDKFDAGPNPIVNQPVRSGNSVLATYDIRRSGESGLEARIKIGPDRDGSGSVKVAKLPEITADAIATAAKQATVDREAREAELAKKIRIPVGQGSYRERDRTAAEIEGDEKLFRLKIRESVLNSPDAAGVLLHESVEDQIKSDPKLKSETGEIDLGEDFWRGIQSGVLRTGYAVDDIAKLIRGDADEGIYSKGDARALAAALSSLEDVYPGSTKWAFSGGGIEKGIQQGAQSFGEMVPSMAGPQLLTKAALWSAGKAGVLQSGLNPGMLSGLAGVAPMAYGGSLEATDREIAGTRDIERLQKLVNGRRSRAALTAASELVTESLFRGNVIFQRAAPSIRRELLRRGLQMPQEGLEEVLQLGIERGLIDPATIGRYDDATATEFLTSFVAGVVATGGMQIASLPSVPAAVRAASAVPAPAQQPAPAAAPTSVVPSVEEVVAPLPVEFRPVPAQAPAPVQPPAPAVPEMEGAPTFLEDPLAPAIEMIEGALRDEAAGSAVLRSRSVDADGRPVAALSYRLVNPSTMEIQHLGSTQPGEGSNLVGQAIYLAKYVRLETIEVDSGASAEGFYEKMGFSKDSDGKMRLRIEPEPSTEQTVEPDETTAFDPARVPIVEVPVSEILLSEDVPNFKEDADPETGVVPGQQLGGKFERLGTPPIVIWERLNGRKEIITGRHRLDLARRSGEETIPSQIVREADGFTMQQALVFDAASNIRDGQGTIRDYADFFRNSPALTEAEAEQGGLLSRAKGRSGWDLGKSASDDLYSLYRAKKITEDRAIAIAQAAPNNPDAQRIGIRYALDKKDPAFISNVIKASGAESAQRGETMDLFGTDDAAMMEMERRATRAGQFQSAIQDRITAAQSAAKRPEAARAMGIDVTDPGAVQARIAELKADVARWQNWPMHPDLVELVKGDGPVTVETASPAGTAAADSTAPAAVKESLTVQPPAEAEGQLVPEAEMPFNLAGETATETEFTPPDTRTQDEIDRDAGQVTMFEDNEGTPAPARATGSSGAFSPKAARSGGNSIRDTGIPTGTEPRAFTLPALVQLAKAIGLDPTVNPKLKSALGRFIARSDAIGKMIPEAVETRAGLFRDPDLAIEVLAHEIGHFIDYTEAHLPRRRIHQRLAPLSKKNWQAIFPTLAANFQGTPAKKLMAESLRKEAVALSENWRGPFAADDTYRNSVAELYADFLSALLNAPQWTRQNAPNLYEGFFNGINQKPTVQAAYQEMQNLLSADLVTQRVMDKMDAAHNEGIGKLIELARPDRVPFRERARQNIATFRQEFLNKWAPISAKEGQFRRAATGDSFTDQLEHNEGYAARTRSLFNDAIRQRVTDPLRAAGVEDSHFSRYLIFNRIIKERRATGQWIEDNPDDARLIMGWLAERFNSSQKIVDQINQAADPSLYNVAARMMRELSDRGLDAETITRVENQAIFDGDLPDALRGKAAKFITAFNVRGFMLNSEGIDVETATEGLRLTRAQVGQAKWSAIEAAARELFTITKPIVEHAIDLGIYGEGVANEVIRPNLSNYIPFQVLEYFDGDVSAAIKEGKGSTKALQDALTAVSLNSQALLGWIQRQQTALILEQWAKTFKVPVTDSGPITKFAGRLKSDAGDVVMIWRNGRPHALTFEEPGIAKAVNYFEELNFLAKLAGEAGGLFGRLFTKYAPGFIVYTNSLRDIQTQAERLGYRRTIRNAWTSARVARDYARASLGQPMTPEIRRLVEEGILPPPEQSIGRMMTESEIRQSLNAGLSARDVAKGRVRAVDDTRLNRLIEMADKPFVYLGALSESIGKVTSEKTLTQLGFDPKLRRKLSKLQGIPNPGSGGTSMKSAAAWSLFFRVIVQGYRAERTFLMNPRTRGGYMLRMGLSQVLPKILMFAAATGGIKALLEGMGGEPGDDLEEFYKSISQYKKEMGSIIPMFWLTPDGIEPVWGHTKDEIGENWQAIGLRIPTSEGGRMWGSLTWNALSESNAKTESPDATRTWTRWVLSQFPGLNPAIDTASKNVQMATGVNPIDSFRNRPIINQTDWTAGGWDKFNAVAKWNFGQVTGSFFRPEVVADTTGLSDFQKGIQQVGPLRSIITMDNYRASREQSIERAEADRISARTKKALGERATELLAIGSRLERMGAGNRSEAQEARYRYFLEFNRQYWEGKVGLRERLKQAVADGNQAEIETVREYLEQGAEQYLGYLQSVR